MDYLILILYIITIKHEMPRNELNIYEINMKKMPISLKEERKK